MTEATRDAQEEAEGGAGKAIAAPPVTKGKAPPAVGKPSAATTGKAAAPIRAQPARRSSPVDEAVDKQRKVLAEALEQAQAIEYEPPPQLKPAKMKKPVKAEKSVKARKPKLVRDSFAMPEGEYARIDELKRRLGGAFKKSELLRAGVAVLCALNDVELLAVMGRIERIKTGRPAKK